MSVLDEPNKPYFSDRLIVDRKEYVVLFPSDVEVVPLCCPVCTYVMRSKPDEEEFSKNKCCHDCAVKFAYPNIEKWKNGWRPTAEELVDCHDKKIEYVLELE